MLVLYKVNNIAYIVPSMRKTLHCAYLFADGHAALILAKVHWLPAKSQPAQAEPGTNAAQP